MELTFWGASGTVTGSKYILKTDNGLKVLLDCGMYQGESHEFKHSQPLPFESNTIDCVLLSHAHIDHSGLLPLLVKQGFKGPIYCTESTEDLLHLMLMDSAHIQEQDLIYVNKIRRQKEMEPLEPLYNLDDVWATLDLIQVVEFGERFSIHNELFVQPFANGHILGSVAWHITAKRKNNKQTSLVFTGDVGRPNDPILRDPSPLNQAEYIICETTYGDKVHPAFEDTSKVLLQLIQKTCVQNKGKIVIPAFSVDRTQELIYAIDKLSFEGKLPSIKVYIDSPMSTRATQIMARHKIEYNDSILEYISRDGDPFCFPNLVYVKDVEQSKSINEDPNPAVIISASGMAEAGRVKHHIKNCISDERNLLLFVGFATPDSLAGKLKNGVSPVRIFGEFYPVKAEVNSLEYFSAHADREELLAYLQSQDPGFVKKVFLVHGRDTARKSFKALLEKEGYVQVEMPEFGSTYKLE